MVVIPVESDWRVKVGDSSGIRLASGGGVIPVESDWRVEVSDSTGITLACGYCDSSGITFVAQ